MTLIAAGATILPMTLYPASLRRLSACRAGLMTEPMKERRTHGPGAVWRDRESQGGQGTSFLAHKTALCGEEARRRRVKFPALCVWRGTVASSRTVLPALPPLIAGALPEPVGLEPLGEQVQRWIPGSEPVLWTESGYCSDDVGPAGLGALTLRHCRAADGK